MLFGIGYIRGSQPGVRDDHSDKVKTSAIHLEHLFGLFPKTAFWSKSGRSALDRALTVEWISKKEKVTTFFLSLAAKPADNGGDLFFFQGAI